MTKTDSLPGLKNWMAASLLLVLSACGGLEMNSGGWGPQLANRPGSSDVFINATAVKVGKGDTVYSIARRHKLSPRDIIVANNLRAPYKLYVGQRLKLPQGQIHTVRSGEYLALIAKRYKTDTWAVARINGIRQPYTIYPGQKLRIPRSGTVSPAAAPTRTVSRQRTTTKKVTPTRKTTRTSKVRIPEPPKRSSGKFGWPVQGKIISNYGSKAKGMQNDGINIAAPRGSNVMAAENGVVAYAGNEIRGFGNLLLVKHSGGWVTAYAHNDQLLVKRGDKVSRGQKIAKVGSTGSVATPQLHFEVRKGSTTVDPRKYM
ncbi:M23 family metallopeptidase [Magnetovibrio sp. PR-2]|uniref:M23 family metallopeptidase n=1 Tax=Magnetovibrio sp. PR-2 TaxID=3120356 RepID=UPI002FCE56A8